MEEHFILRLPAALAERLNKILDDNPEAGGADAELDLSFQGTPTLALGRPGREEQSIVTSVGWPPDVTIDCSSRSAHSPMCWLTSREWSTSWWSS